MFEKNFSLTDVYGAEEAFVTGTFAGLVPVREIDGRAITDGRGPMVERLQQLYKARIEADVRRPRGRDRSAPRQPMMMNCAAEKLVMPCRSANWIAACAPLPSAS